MATGVWLPLAVRNGADLRGHVQPLSPAGLDRGSAAGAGSDPLVAIVIPVYRQAQYLRDSVCSSVQQALHRQTKVVVVSDGCPDPTTDVLARCFRHAFPGQVYYLKKPNAGLASARNAGIRFALAAWPSIQAVFPLDADNRLSNATISKLWATLSTAPDDVGWVYQDLTAFGASSGRIAMGVPFSIYRLVHENFCDAGSLIHRRVFDAGIWFDQAMTGNMMGYEDWDFFLHAALRGFRGCYVSNTDFYYRKHDVSLIDGAQINHYNIYHYMLRKHARTLRAANLISQEHQEIPRFALVPIGHDNVKFFSNCSDIPASEVPVAEFLDILASWYALDAVHASEGQHQIFGRYLPPVTLLAREEDLTFLQHLRVLPGLLFAAQKALITSDWVAVTLHEAEDATSMHIQRADWGPGEIILLAIRSRALIWPAAGEIAELLGPRDSDASPSGVRLALTVGSAYFRGTGRSAPGSGRRGHGTCLLDAARRLAEPVLADLCASAPPPDFDDDVLSESRLCPTDYATYRQLGDQPLRLPDCAVPTRAGRRSVEVIVVVRQLGGSQAGASMVHLAHELRRQQPLNRLHLLITDAAGIERGPGCLEVFQTITSMASMAGGRMCTLQELLAGADFAIFGPFAGPEELFDGVSLEATGQVSTGERWAAWTGLRSAPPWVWLELLEQQGGRVGAELPKGNALTLPEDSVDMAELAAQLLALIDAATE